MQLPLKTPWTIWSSSQRYFLSQEICIRKVTNFLKILPYLLFVRCKWKSLPSLRPRYQFLKIRGADYYGMMPLSGGLIKTGIYFNDALNDFLPWQYVLLLKCFIWLMMTKWYNKGIWITAAFQSEKLLTNFSCNIVFLSKQLPNVFTAIF